MTLDQKKALAEQKAQELLKVYKIKGFTTTTESIQFMRKFSTFSNLQKELDKNKELDISKLFDILDPVLVKDLIENYVERHDQKKLEYEKEFVGEFETVFMLFMLTFQQLMEQSTGQSEGKPQEGLSSTKRALGS